MGGVGRLACQVFLVREACVSVLVCGNGFLLSGVALQFESMISSAFRLLYVQFSHPYVTTGETIALTMYNSVGKVMFLLFNMLSRFVIAFLPRSKHLFNSWPQSPSAEIWESKK